MPYIEQKARRTLDEGRTPMNAGELNYVLTNVLLRYLKLHGKSYSSYNTIMGALEGAKLELYRRQIADYEDRKALENGDIY